LAENGTTWQRSTVLTLLQRLEKKGFVTSDRASPKFVFRATLSREDLAHERMKELVEELAGGRPASLLLTFAERSKFSRHELQELREFIDELLRKRRPSEPKSKGDRE
jgi:predicted transcriptional regulator